MTHPVDKWLEKQHIEDEKRKAKLAHGTPAGPSRRKALVRAVSEQLRRDLAEKRE